MTTADINMVAVVKGTERYIVLFPATQHGKRQALRAIGKWTANRDLSFNWFDAAATALKIQETTTT